MAGYDIVTITGLAKRVGDAIKANSSGLQDIVSTYGGGWGNTRTVDPNLDGSWPVQGTRPAGGIIRWRRYITATTIAEPPTAADGYLDGDEVWPTPETAASTKMLWSDSFEPTATTDQAFSTRTGDAYAGGAAPTWVGDLSQSVGGGRLRVFYDGRGLSFYSNVWVRATAPSLPTTGTWRFTFTLTSLNDNTFYVPLRANTYNAATLTRIRFKNDMAGNLIVTLIDAINGSSIIGQAPWQPGVTTVAITFDGTTVHTTIGATELPAATVTTGLPRLPELVLHAGSYCDVSMKNLQLEVL